MTTPAEIPLGLVRLKIAVPTALGQLGAVIAGIVFAILTNWTAVSICAGIYVLTTIVRMLEARRRTMITIHDDRFTIGERSFSWDQLRTIDHGVLKTSEGLELHLVPLGDG